VCEVSETDSEGVSNSISQIISHALCKTEGKALDWAPSTLNVCRIFINCGMLALFAFHATATYKVFESVQ
jgi:hypothetical protein